MELTFVSCESCSIVSIPPQYVCPQCYSEQLAETKVSGRGKIYSYTTIYAAPEKFAQEAPYHVILVQLDAGLKVTARLVSGEPKIDQCVELRDIINNVYWFESI